jgi:hypothetical protein
MPTADQADRLREEYFHAGFQYYTAARFAVATWAYSVAGNLFHHAIEMMLKGGLAAYATEQERRRMGHKLPEIWRAFKAQHPTADLSAFDSVVGELHRFEDIRYPERTTATGINTIFGFGGKPTSPTLIVNPAGSTPPLYEIWVGEIDALVAAICSANTINPKFFTTRLQGPGQTYLRHENAEAGLF